MSATAFQNKMLAVPFQKGLSKNDKGFLTITGKFTSDEKDQVGDIITRSATEKALPQYRQWGNIRRMHQPDPVAVVTRIGTDDGLPDWNDVEITVIDPKAIFEVENGLLKALSVGILVNLDKVDMLNDGGWVINEYQLAEISLVDHPANYDAKLNVKEMSKEFREAAREKGFAAALKSLGNQSIQETEKMELPITPKAEEPVAPVAEPVLEAAPAQEVAPVEETPEPVAEPAVEEPKGLDVEHVKSLVTEAVAPLIKHLEAMATLLAEQHKAITEKAPEPIEEPAQVTGDAGAGEDVIKSLQGQVAELEKRIADLSTGSYTGAAPVEEVIETEAPAEKAIEESPADLRGALRKFIQTKSK